MTEPDPPAARDLSERAQAALRVIALRAEAARRLTPAVGAQMLQSIVEATVALFGAEAASLALYDPETNRLVFRVAAGAQGAGVVGLEILPDQGVAGYVFATGQPLALADVAGDARFGRGTAEQTGYVPRSLIAVPLLDGEGTIGVLEVIDKRDEDAFSLRDVELASVFAAQATVAIRASRVERDTAALIRSALGSLAAGGRDALRSADVEAIVSDAVAGLSRTEDGSLWELADQIARLRAADSGELELVTELLAVLVARAERAGAARERRRSR